ncbi:MAG: hypothetical protein ACYSWX_00755 [Planctomycetota bacterium]
MRAALERLHTWLGALIVGSASEHAAPAEPRRRPSEPVSLDLVRGRARAKSAACRRLREVRESGCAALGPESVDEIVRSGADLAGCHFFVLEPTASSHDPEALHLAERAFGNLALAAEVARRHEDTFDRSDVPPADLLYTFAEAQSALRAALQGLGVGEDVDQLDLFRWVRDQAFEHRVFIPRYFRADDLADPRQWEGLQERLDALAERLERTGQDRRERRRLLAKLSLHLRELAEDRYRLDSGSWPATLRTVEEWVSGGRSSAAVDLVDPLSFAVERWPSDLVPSAIRCQAATATGPPIDRRHFSGGYDPEQVATAIFAAGNLP